VATRYTFNENEFWDAFRYFRRPGVRFEPAIAYLNDLSEMLGFLRGQLAGDRRRELNQIFSLIIFVKA